MSICNTDNVRKKLIILYKRGKDLRELGKICHKSHEWVRTLIGEEYIRHKHGIPKEKIIKTYEEEGTYRAAAKKLNITPAYVFRIVQENEGK